ncbi:nuclear transport factor 2 family protein [Phenylobacterium montanum]|uniref:Nuclear transport factor 2 family protein n=1 Tax=Phenylobacterium montanum TaxID=2823693 RepID=A0A975IY90_9CAUL|nr:nuclear transport factor 2 family protein [Caulobacter sp. S6]QUD90211.1 nuclear transport factor 2 family protein [Caulobacter sp. S6]
MDEKSILEANKQAVARFMELLVDPNKSDQVADFITESYIQHNPNIPSGRQAIIDFTKSERAQTARDEMRPAGRPVLVAEGDLVVMMLPRKVPHPTRPGEFYNSYWFDMWRIENGKLAEHWDAAPLEP